jgi:hypothetical protein
MKKSSYCKVIAINKSPKVDQVGNGKAIKFGKSALKLVNLVMAMPLILVKSYKS